MKKKKKSNNIFSQVDLSFDFWPLLLVLILMFGVLYMNFFYMYYFDFKVFSYLDISEIFIGAFVNLGTLDLLLSALLPTFFITIFSRDIVNFLIFIFLKVFELFLLVKSTFRVRRIYVLIKITKKKWVNIFENNVDLTLYISSLIYLIFKYYFSFSPWSSFNKNGIGIFSIWVMLLFYIIAKPIKAIINKSKRYSIGKIWTLFTILFLITLLIVSLKIRHYTIVKGHYSYGTKVIMEKDTIVSDSNFYYIDKTKAFLFMWSVKDTAMTVIPMSDVKKLVIHNGVPDKNSKKTAPKKNTKPAQMAIKAPFDTTKSLKGGK